MTVESLQQILRSFASERDWEQFHTPRNLILALGGEVGELAELFQWVDDASVPDWLSDTTNIQRLSSELADVFSYLLRIADVCGIDLERALHDKIALNQDRYPEALSRGNAKKYTEFE